MLIVSIATYLGTWKKLRKNELTGIPNFMIFKKKNQKNQLCDLLQWVGK